MCLIQTHCNSVQVVIETVPLESDHNSSRPNSGQKLWTSQLVSSLNSCGALSFVDPSLFSSSLSAKRSIAFSCQAVHLVLVIPEFNKLSNFALKLENHEVERQWWSAGAAVREGAELFEQKQRYGRSELIHTSFWVNGSDDAAIELVAPELVIIDVLSKFTRLSSIYISKPVQDIERLLHFFHQHYRLKHLNST